jgi:hypothetical protein
MLNRLSGILGHSRSLSRQFCLDFLLLFALILSHEPQYLFHADIGPDRGDTQVLTFVSGSGKYKLFDSIAIVETLDKSLLPLLWSWNAENNTQIGRAIRLLFRCPLFAFR